MGGGVPEGVEFVPGFGFGFGFVGALGDVVVPVPGDVCVLGPRGLVVAPGVAVLAPGVAVLAPGVGVDGELEVPGVDMP